MGIPISNCFIVPTESLSNAQVGLRVDYQQFWLPYFTRRITSVFTVRSIGVGHFYWYSSPG